MSHPTSTMKSLSVLLFVLAALLTVGCGSSKPIANRYTETEPRLYEWNDQGGPGELKVRINLSSQRASFTRGGHQVGWCYVATGREGRSTPVGTFRVTEKIVDKESNRYGWIEDEYGNTIDHDASPGDRVPGGARYVPAPMPYWMRLTGSGIGMHAGVIPQPGMPASHGCIRLPKPLAPQVFHAVKVGTPVTIEYGGSDSWEVHPPAPAASLQPVRQSEERRYKGRRVISPDNPWIVWPEGHPRARTHGP